MTWGAPFSLASFARRFAILSRGMRSGSTDTEASRGFVKSTAIRQWSFGPRIVGTSCPWSLYDARQRWGISSTGGDRDVA